MSIVDADQKPSASIPIKCGIGSAPGLVIAAPASNSGKTVVTLALMRALTRRGRSVAPLKIGPDYIDPAFHAIASGRDGVNLDPWSMRREMGAHQIARQSEGADVIVVEGVMGLFDGATDGTGSTADVAAQNEWPVILVVDVKGQGASAAAIVRGFRYHREDCAVEAVIFNNVGGKNHETILRDAMERAMPGFPVLGYLPRNPALRLPSRHLGLVQAAEHPDIDVFIDEASLILSKNIDMDMVERLPLFSPFPPPDRLSVPAPPGQRIALARDAAFAFSYPHLLDGWRAAGAEIVPFSPLGGEGPDDGADAIYLPGGYPELYPGAIAGNAPFMDGLRRAAAASKPVYGECGGYMVLGRGLVDAEGAKHEMAGLLPLETSFAERKLSLGYRRAVALGGGMFPSAGRGYRGHEFHYATIVEEGDAPRLFQLRDAPGADLGEAGLRVGSVMGSFLHIVDIEE